ncbi:subtilisin-like protein [Myriangium duriaei CBS 260.36]|uniref:Subtilisin-like protein n=1 Tax=Myriangium duriaei CBS 260.36 TaxID=1168546 RepID=A0A9P4MI79_9PEZI|nr:subtilisin-like protein [Myriangium duriaei CBS 260.36]
MAEHLIHVRSLHSEALARRNDGKIFDGVTHEYNVSEFQGYGGHFEAFVIEQLRTHQDVAAIEPDQHWTFDGVPANPGPMVQANAAWHLSQISHRELGTGNEGYVYNTEAHGTFAYIIDGGITPEHQEFSARNGRARSGFDIVKGGNGQDLHGHGTHVAALIGGKTFGVAKDATLISVKVFEGAECTTRRFLKGYEYATKSIRGTKSQAHSVINVSIGGGWSWAMNRAVTAASKKGITTVVSAGNSNKKTCWTKNAIVVGAADATRRRAKFSNFGSSVALFAPGVNIRSAWTGYGNDRTLTISGTSQAAPLVAGVILTLKATQHLPDHKSTRDALLKLATPNVVGDANGSPNLFLYNGSGR